MEVSTDSCAASLCVKIVELYSVLLPSKPVSMYIWRCVDNSVNVLIEGWLSVCRTVQFLLFYQRRLCLVFNRHLYNRVDYCPYIYSHVCQTTHISTAVASGLGGVWTDMIYSLSTKLWYRLYTLRLPGGSQLSLFFKLVCLKSRPAIPLARHWLYFNRFFFKQQQMC